MALTKITNDLLDLGSDTGALGLPKGTEAQRPSNPVEGTLRHNSEIDETKLETYNGTEWRKINAVVPLPYSVDYLVVAGGAGGGGDMGGGGGAGGYLTNSFEFQPSASYSVTVGAGGQRGSGVYNNNATNGGNSSLIGGDLSVTSIGGGKGASRTSSGAKITGGSGGSGGGGSGLSGGGTGGTGGSGTSGQGFNGGSGISAAAIDGGGGGGGASQVGESAFNNSSSGDGGDGKASSITGTSIYYGGGGAGSAYGSGTATGGLGGGGDSRSNGVPNTGGGGGGSSSSDVAGNGGSGVVILRMPIDNYSGTTTGTPTVTTDGTDTILTYTSSGTYTA